MNFLSAITAKKLGKPLDTQQIEYFSQAAAEELVPDYQLAAMLMAIRLNGMDARETADLTMAMARSGDMLDPDVGGVPVDKHSTGGVGDTTTLVLAPLVASCGGKVLKMSGRGLGHTGGTVDKLESIPGMQTSLPKEQFLDIVRKVGCAVVGQSAELAPADKRLYALRDVTSTVDSIPLIAASILSKKFAAGATALVLDVKYGSGAIMDTMEKSLELARTMVDIGTQAGRHVIAVLTGMEEPLGTHVGNALEVKEAIAVLRGEDVPDLKELCMVLGSNILVRSGLAADEAEARSRLEKAIDSGAALKKLADMVTAQGGDAAAVYDTSLLPAAPVQYSVKAPRDGYIAAMEARDIGLVSMHLGGGRATKEDEIDQRVGVVLRAKCGAYLRAGDELAVIHAADEDAALAAEKELLACYTFADEPAERPTFIRGVVC